MSFKTRNLIYYIKGFVIYIINRFLKRFGGLGEKEKYSIYYQINPYSSIYSIDNNTIYNPSKRNYNNVFLFIGSIGTNRRLLIEVRGKLLRKRLYIEDLKLSKTHSTHNLTII